MKVTFLWDAANAEVKAGDTICLRAITVSYNKLAKQPTAAAKHVGDRGMLLQIVSLG